MQEHGGTIRSTQNTYQESSCHLRFSSSRRWVKLKERILHVLINFHYGCLVAATIAIVRCAKKRDDVLVMTPVVTIHNELMRTHTSVNPFV